MADKILYTNKEKLIDDSSIPLKNKVTADDMNEIKEVVNSHADDIGTLDNQKADRTEIPTDLSELSNATTKFVNETQLGNEATARQNADNDLQGQINNRYTKTEIDNKFDVTNGNIATLQVDSAHTIELSINQANYVTTATLKNKAGTIISSSNIDLPLESMIVNGTYDNATKKIILTLQNGNTIEIPVGDLISGLQSEITPQNKLSSDLVDDTNHTNKFVTQAEKNQIETNKLNIENIKNINNGEFEEKTVSTNEKENILIDSLEKQAKIKIKGNLYQKNIPNEYQAVEYIETDRNYNNQYIDTGITGSNTVEIDITFNTSNEFSTTSGRYGAIFGSRTNSKVQEYQLSTYSGTGQQGIFRINNTEINAQLEREQKINVKIKNSKYYVNDVEKSTIDTATVFDNGKNMYLFGLNNKGTFGQHGNLKLYDFKIWKDNTLVRYFVPVYRKIDLVAGLYDLVSDTFFTNQGTGNFLYGTNISIPNLDYPQPIKIVSGNNTIKVSNKNWVTGNVTNTSRGITTTLNNNILTVQGTTVGNWWTGIEVNANIPKGDWAVSIQKALPFTLNFILTLEDDTTKNLSIAKGNLTANGSISSNAIKYNINFASAETGATYDETIELQLEKGSQTKYEPHKEQIYPINLPVGMFMAKIQNNEDKIEGSINNWYIPNKILKIDSYNGETITTPYISTTGGLDIGATVYYVGTETLPITDTTLITQLNDINQNFKTYSLTTNIVQTNDSLPFELQVDYSMSNLYRIKKLEADYPTLPEYWADYLKTKYETLDNLDATVGNNGDSFVFITDVHMNNNNMKSPLLIENILKNTSTNQVVCGGDILTSHNTQKEAIEKLANWRNKFSTVANMMNVLGNHDLNYTGNSENTDAYLTMSQFFGVCLKKYENVIKNSNIYGSDYPCYYDNESQKIRYIYLYSGSGNDEVLKDIQLTRMQELITELSTDWSVIVFTHIFFNPATSDRDIVTVNEKGIKIMQFIDDIYDTCDATIIGVISGHMHRDYSIISTKGYPIIATTCDASGSPATTYDRNFPNRIAGTTTEQAFDIFHIDKTNRKIYATRIGAGIDREFTY